MRHADGRTVTEQRIVTSRERFTAVFGERLRARMLLEASTESEWVAQHLEALGHEVIVADPNYAPMYATRSRRVKTDKRDARTLVEACRIGAYRPAHRRLGRAAARAGGARGAGGAGADADAVCGAGQGAGAARWLAGAEQ